MVLRMGGLYRLQAAGVPEAVHFGAQALHLLRGVSVAVVVLSTFKRFCCCLRLEPFVDVSAQL
jgi:hypothetical protein